ncbi:MAG: hypothetical protein RID91_15945, partial [Azospirillaceae bacterium]
TVGGGARPRGDRLDRLAAAVVSYAGGRADALGGGRTLAGCRILPRDRGARLAICRELAAVAPPVPVAPGAAVRWDGRFRVTLSRDARMPPGATIGAAGSGARARPGVPIAVLRTLPALSTPDGALVSAEIDTRQAPAASVSMRSACVVFAPDVPLAAAAFGIV